MTAGEGSSNVDFDIVPPEAIALLRQCGAMQRPHGERTLFEHLVGTYSLLKSWDNPESVCLGGLFHSIYGTNAFKHQSLPECQRTQLQNLIGIEAEYLAWRFCNIDRPRAILDAFRKREPSAEWIGLIEIEAANLIEQGDIGSITREMFCIGLDQPGTLSQGSITALLQALSRQHVRQKTGPTLTGAQVTQEARS